MTDISEERRRMLVKVSTLYYTDGLNQQEIAGRLGISRPLVSRMLSAARREGIVKISIHNPYAEELQYEKAIIETFGIRDVVIQNTEGMDSQMAMQQLARVGSALLEPLIKDQDVIGVMAGQAISALGSELGYFTRKHLRIIPLVGGWGAEGRDWHANSNARLFGERLNAKYWQLHAPAIVRSWYTRDALVNEPEISEVLEMGRGATLSIVGIGQLDEQATIVQTGVFHEDKIQELRSLGAAANICTSFIDTQGAILDVSGSCPMIGVSINELKQSSKIIAVAYGEGKVPAITAALRGRWMDILVTNLKTAKSILAFHRTKTN